MATGLREAKRHATTTAIEDAALDLMDTRGYDAVTVEMICEQAEVSRRTFFNYFGSKDAAVLGTGPADIPADVEEAFVTAGPGNILRDLVQMMTQIIVDGPAHADPAQWRRRHRVIQSSQTLSAAFAERIAAKDAHLHGLVHRRILSRHDLPSEPDALAALTDTTSRQAAVIVSLWWGVARSVMTLRTTNPELTTTDLTATIIDTLTLLQEAEL